MKNFGDFFCRKLFLKVEMNKKIFLGAMNLYYGDRSTEITANILAGIVCIAIFYNILFAPIYIGEIFFGIKIPNAFAFLWAIFLIIIYIYLSDSETKQTYYLAFLVFLGIFVILSNIISGYIKNDEKKVSSKNYSSHYHSSSGNYSNSSYRHSEHSSYTPPIERNSSDENKIPVAPPKISEETKIQESQTEEKISEEQKNSDEIKIENNIPQIDEDKKEFSEPKTESENRIQKSSDYESYLADKWEFVTSDGFGNDYYINKNYSVSIFNSPIEGKIFSAEFKKVLKIGYYVDVPALDRNYRLTYEKKFLSHEKCTVRFRNENGFKEISFMPATGYDENDSIIVGYESTQTQNFMEWEYVNNQLYNELYEAAYSRLK